VRSGHQVIARDRKGKTLPLIYTDNTDQEKDRVIARDREIVYPDIGRAAADFFPVWSKLGLNLLLLSFDIRDE